LILTCVNVLGSSWGILVGEERERERERKREREESLNHQIANIANKRGNKEIQRGRGEKERERKKWASIHK